METKDKITFEIDGIDFKNVKKFRKQHKDCACGMACEQFTYSFTPSGLGLAAGVQCSCGQHLLLSGFMDSKPEEYNEADHPVLTEEDHKNMRFEEAIKHILFMKNPRHFRIGFMLDQSFEMIYAVSVTVARYADKRIEKCLLWKVSEKKYHRTNNYDGLNEDEKIAKFYEYFEEHVKEELKKYECRDKRLMEDLGLIVDKEK